jgi:hypothetical protein
MTEPELRALAWKIAEDRVIGMWNVPQRLWLMVFMPLAWMKQRDLLKHKHDVVYAIVGEDTTVPGRAINGFPMFASCRFLPRAHFDQVNVLVDEARAKKDAFLTAPAPTPPRPGRKKPKREP